MFQQWRYLLRAVAERHQMGYECARIVPWIEDTAGGGDWHCIIAPAAMISPSHGAKITEHIKWRGGTCPPGRDFPYVIGRAVRGLPRWPPFFGSVENLLSDYPKPAERNC
jgi:hypothetical protein